ncbi:SMP-30/gluconolactonase/LRE family protein [Hymenobacter sp. 15J16-1T3B]|uniref:NHL repeat-containing protein n=1 Tax=Hymenobacter sp. 15J16-1T3B TaxID=2886941 RepID=UPI001D1046E5|nr:NHL repeat-containing protein [Hymenobacter sp. 15J16-1T3B]MCC3157174.1 SMP-30/gluconolactonase/LRE family protein [Hymenobacter sp. 15J16-1T3B]
MSLVTKAKVGSLLVLGLLACKKEQAVEKPAEKPGEVVDVSNLAGGSGPGYVNGPGSTAQFAAPQGVAVDAQGNIYVAEVGSAGVRKITPAGMVSTLSGGMGQGWLDGALASARFYTPLDVAVDRLGNLYVADHGGHRIRKITSTTVSTLAGTGVAGFADGPGATAQFNAPNGIAVDAQGVVYVSDSENYRIRKIMPDGTVSTLAGTGQRGIEDGPASTAQFSSTQGLAVDAQGTVYVADVAAHRIRKILPNATVTTVAGTGTVGWADGAASSAKFSGPRGVTLDAGGNLYVVDSNNNCIRKITPAGQVSTVAGTRAQGYADGPGATAQFDAPIDIAYGGSGTFYVSEWGLISGARIRKVTVQ